MSFEILIHDDLSVADLIQLHKNNGVVLKTPHIGNIYPNNLAMASLGIPMLFYDRTIGNKDRNFHPHKIIYNGTSEIIANPDVISVGSRIIACPQNFKDECRIGANMVDLHMTVMKKVFPSSPLFTYSEYLSRNKKTVLDILKIISKSHPELWERIVDEKGYVHKKKVGSWSEVESMGIYGISNPESGWLIPNVVNILFHGTIDASEKRVTDVYLLSGPDMYKYINSYKTHIDDLYESVRTNIFGNLPHTMRCHIIPVADMRFIIEDRKKEVLDVLILKYQELMIAKHTYDEIMRKKSIKRDIIELLAKNYDDLGRTMFYEIEKANALTQYDMYRDKINLYVPHWALQRPMNEVSSAFKLLKRYYTLSNRMKISNL